jgi:mono/diheme cytochrome c family protein
VISIPFVALMAIAQLIFAYNLIRTIRGETRAHDEKTLLADARQMGLASTVVTLGVIAPIVVLALTKFAPEGPGAAPAAAPQQQADARAVQLFTANCGSCHTLSAAGTSGTIGPDLDAQGPQRQQVLDAIENGGAGTGAMPAGLLEGGDAELVADLVSGSE